MRFNVIEHPTAAWTAQQIIEAFPVEPTLLETRRYWRAEAPDWLSEFEQWRGFWRSQ